MDKKGRSHRAKISFTAAGTISSVWNGLLIAYSSNRLKYDSMDCVDVLYAERFTNIFSNCTVTYNHPKKQMGERFLRSSKQRSG